MQVGIQVQFPTNPGADFTAAILHGAASAVANIKLPKSLWGRTLIRSITIKSMDNCAWELNWFWSSAGPTDDVATDTWLGRWQFAEADGIRIPGSLPYLYTIPEIVQPYQDRENANRDAQQYMHLMLVNRSAANDKAADAAGAILIQMSLEPMGQNN